MLAFLGQAVLRDPARAERVRTTRLLWLTVDIGGLAGVDKTCHQRLSGPRGNIGAPGALVTTERTEVAPAFYACGTSFTKFVVGSIGLPDTIALVPLIFTEGALPRIERLTGTSMETLRSEWRRAIEGR